MAEVLAASGYWQDVQTAVDQVTALGGGNVRIPAGTFNFVDVGEWSGVQYKPMVFATAGVNFLGAPYTTDANGMVVGYGTILRVPWEVNIAGDSWIGIQGTGNKNTGYGGWQNDPVPNDPSIHTRISGIWFQGYRYLVNRINGVEMTPPAIHINELQSFRIDHCHLSDCTATGMAFGFYGVAGGNSQITSNGVIDHCRLINDGDCHLGPGGSVNGETVDYGIGVGRTHAVTWNHDPTQVFGKATPYTIFIENCELSKWRHCVSSIDGAHIVFRYNKIYQDLGFGSVDQHGTYTSVGARAIEMYGNQFVDCMVGWNQEVNRLRGGAGMFYDNYVDPSYVTFVGTSNDYLVPDYATVGYMPDCPLYLWNNNIGSATLYTNGAPNPLVVGQNVFLAKPSWYTAYPYPHPLAMETQGVIQVDSTIQGAKFAITKL